MLFLTAKKDFFFNKAIFKFENPPGKYFGQFEKILQIGSYKSMVKFFWSKGVTKNKEHN